jgi:hypothetical protein
VTVTVTVTVTVDVDEYEYVDEDVDGRRGTMHGPRSVTRVPRADSLAT